MKPTTEDVIGEGAHDPDELEDRADELEIEARRLRQRARRLRRGGSSIEWLDEAGLERLFGFKMRRIVDASRRGEIEIGRAGRSPRVRRADVERWLRDRARRAPRPVESGVDPYQAAVSAFARRSA